MVRLLLVGLGRQGRRYERIVRTMAGVELAATVDVRPEAIDGVPHWSTVSGALAGGGFDAAVVTSPSPLHFEHAVELIEAGIPVLVEKPLATSEADARTLEEKARGKGVYVATGHVERFNPAVQLVRSMLAAGEVGTPISLSFRRVGLPPRSGHTLGVVHDLAVHDIDVFSYLVGEPVLEGASGWPRTNAPEAAYVVVSSGEVIGLVEANWRTPVRIRRLSMTTDSCVVAVDYTSQRVEVTEASGGDNPLDFLAFQAQYTTSKTALFEAPATEPLAEELKAFVGVVSGTPSTVLANAAEGRRAVAIAEAAGALIASTKT